MLEKIQFMTLMFIGDLKAKRDERGATAVEYGLMVALIAAAIVVTVTGARDLAQRPVHEHHRHDQQRRLSLCGVGAGVARECGTGPAAFSRGTTTSSGRSGPTTAARHTEEENHVRQDQAAHPPSFARPHDQARRDGATAVEYALMTGFIAAVIVTAVAALGAQVAGLVRLGGRGFP